MRLFWGIREDAHPRGVCHGEPDREVPIMVLGEAVHLGSLRRTLARTYLTVDGRSLALCRIGLALVLIADLLRRVPWLRDLYSNAGLLPNHTMLWQPPLPRLFSVFFMASHVDEAAVGFAIAFFCFVCLLVGWRTRLFHILSFAMTTSLHDRILVVENWGTVALGALMLWTAFLPLGRRFSVDALVSTLRAGSGERPDDLAAPRIPVPDTRPAVSLAVLALLLQLAVIYGLNFAHKTGETWRHGTAVHYVLYQERIVTWLGVWARQHLPFAVTKGMTYGTLMIEASAPVLILTPIFWRQTRLLAILLLTLLHTGISLFANLGIFSAAMIAFYPLLLDSAHWDWLSRRLGAYGRVAWASNRDDAAGPAGVAWDRRLRPWMRELGVALALAVLGADLSVSNPAVPRALRWDGRPQWMAEAVMYPHIFEGWGMFSPDAPLGDEMVVVDAVTSDGRHVDPYNEAGSRVHALPVDDIPVRLGHDSMFCDYTLRIPGDRAYHQALKEWILRYPERTGNPRDAIVSFEATKVEHDSPPPGKTRPTNVRREVFLRWTADR
jgi:hypothetical protein